MTILSRKFAKGIRLKSTTDAPTLDGEIVNDTTDKEIKVFLDSAERAVVTKDQVQTLTNKTIDANGTGNSITNLETADFATNVIDTDVALTADSDTRLASQKAVKAYVDTKVAGKDDASEITYTPGVLAHWDLSSDPGNTDAGLDQLAERITNDETALSDHIADTVGAHAASAIANTPAGNLVATDVQTALDELQSDVDTRTVASGGSLTSGSLITPIRSDVKQDTDANLVTYASTASDGQLCFATDTKKMYQVIDNVLKSVGGAGTNFEITQAAHGLAVGDGIYHNGTIFVKAKADADTTLAYQVVVVVTNVNTFTAADFGRVEALSHGFTIGEYYFQSEVTAGLATITEPSIGFSNPLFYVEDANTLQIKCLRPNAIDGGITVDQLNDVSAPSPSNGDLLSYVTSNSRYENVSVTGDVVGTTGIQVLTNKDIDGGTASNTSRTTLPKDTKTNLDALTRKEGTLVYATDNAKPYFDDGSNLVEVGSGSGSGGINYLEGENTNAENTIGDWIEYNDAAGVNPVNGVDQAAAQLVTFTRNTTTPLRGTADFKFTKTSVSNQGHGASVPFTIDLADKAKKLTISIDYDASHAGYADDDVRFSVYDITNSQLIRINGEDLKGGKGTHYAQFQTASDSVSYRLIAHVSSTNAAAYDLYFDNFSVGPTNLAFGAIVLDSEAYTPSNTQGFGTITGATLEYNRVGEYMEVEGTFVTGTVTGDIAQLSLPNGHTIASDSSRTYHGEVIRAGGTRVTVVGVAGRNYMTFGAGGSSHGDVVGSSLFGSSESLLIRFRVKITGWSSNALMSQDLGGRDVIVEGAGNGGGIVTSVVTDIDFTEVTDTTASWNGTQFTAPETGNYQVEGMAFFAANTATLLRAYVNTVGDRYISAVQASTTAKGISGTIPLNKGDVLSIRADITGTLSNNTSVHWIHIQKLASPQTIFSPESSAPTIQKFTSGSGTYTTPRGVKYIKVKMAGGGGGGAGSGNGAASNGVVGGTTTFGTTLLSAVGGAAGPTNGPGGAGGTASLGTGPIGAAIKGGSGGGYMALTGGAGNGIHHVGGHGGDTPYFSGGGSSASGGSAAQAGNANSGGGGAGGGTGGVADVDTGCGGGSGGFIDAIISTPLATYSYTVGAGGGGGALGTSGYSGAAGGSGIIIVEEYYS